MTSFLQIPDVSHYWLLNGRTPSSMLVEGSLRQSLIERFQQGSYKEDLVAVDVEVQGDKILRVVSAGSNSPGNLPAVDVRSGLIWPCFVDIHTHLDKGHIWSRSPNPNGTFAGALETVHQDSSRWWQAEDVYRRAEFGLRCSYAHGTQAIRTHLDSFDAQGDISFGVFRQLKQEWANRIHLQAVCLVTLDYFLTLQGEKLADLVADSGGVLGGVAFMNPDIVCQIDRVFELAQERQLDLDFHTDESLDPEDIALRLVAEAAVRHQFTGKITCGHCCSLSVQSDSVVQKTVAAVKAANISIVSLPMCNLYLQDRQAADGAVRTPR
ncbi:MAG: cytosine deaminase [Phormidesmis sp.]